MTTPAGLDPRDRDSQVRLELERAFAPDGRPKCPALADMLRALRPMSGSALMRQSVVLWVHTRDCPVCRPRFEAMHAGEAPRRPEIGWDGTHLSARVERFVAWLPAALRPPEGEAGATRRLTIAMAVPIAVITLYYFMWGVIGALRTPGTSHRELLQAVSAVLIAPATVFVAIYLAGWTYDATRSWKDRFLGYVVRATCAVGFVGSGIVGTISLVGADLSPGNGTKIVVGLFAAGALAGVLLWVSDRLKGTGGYSGLSRTVPLDAGRAPMLGAGLPASRRTLSSGLTFFAKVILPAVAFSLLALFTWYAFHDIPPSSLLPWHGVPFSKGMNPFQTMLASILIVLAFFLNTFRWTMRAQRVRIDGEVLLISNYRRQITVPLRDVAGVGVRYLGLVRMVLVLIRLREPTALGKDIYFLPRVGLDWPRAYDLVSDLRTAVEAAEVSTSFPAPQSRAK